MNNNEAVTGLDLKPRKPDAFDGKRDYLVVNTWIYKLEQYFTMVQLANPNHALSEANRVIFASTFLTGIASTWWFTKVQSNTAPDTWNGFKEVLRQEFIPSDHIRRSRDKLRRLQQTSSVAKYLSEFRNIALSIPTITADEKWDRFCAGLKKEVRLEVMKSAVIGFEEAAQVALRVDSALYGNDFYLPKGGSIGSEGSNNQPGPTPMELGNLEKTRKPFKGGKKDWDAVASYGITGKGSRG